MIRYFRIWCRWRWHGIFQNFCVDHLYIKVQNDNVFYSAFKVTWYRGKDEFGDSLCRWNFAIFEGNGGTEQMQEKASLIIPFWSSIDFIFQLPLYLTHIQTYWIPFNSSNISMCSQFYRLPFSRPFNQMQNFLFIGIWLILSITGCLQVACLSINFCAWYCHRAGKWYPWKQQIS